MCQNGDRKSLELGIGLDRSVEWAFGKHQSRWPHKVWGPIGPPYLGSPKPCLLSFLESPIFSSGFPTSPESTAMSCKSQGQAGADPGAPCCLELLAPPQVEIRKPQKTYHRLHTHTSLGSHNLTSWYLEPQDLQEFRWKGDSTKLHGIVTQQATFGGFPKSSQIRVH